MYIYNLVRMCVQDSPVAAGPAKCCHKVYQDPDEPVTSTGQGKRPNSGCVCLMHMYKGIHKPATCYLSPPMADYGHMGRSQRKNKLYPRCKLICCTICYDKLSVCPASLLLNIICARSFRNAYLVFPKY